MDVLVEMIPCPGTDCINGGPQGSVMGPREELTPFYDH